MCEIKKIRTLQAPEAIGPYSQAVLYKDLVFVSGQIPINPEIGKIVDGGIEVQTHRCIKNISAILKESNSFLENVLKVEVYIDDIADFNAMNEVYIEYFTGDVKPARSVVEISKIPKNALIEIACVAVTGNRGQGAG